MPDVERNKRIVIGQHRDVWSHSNPDAVDKYYAHDAVCHLPGRELTGIAEIKALVTKRRSAFPDWHEHVELAIAEGDTVATRVTSTATHEGPFLGLAATGARITLSEMFFFRLRDGLIVECWAEFDVQSLLRQIEPDSVGN
jgi:steroid delta-isomerase-like uncharacterized protein